MNELMFYAVIWVSFFACLFLAWYFSNKAKYEERKMLIQQGANLDELLKRERGFKFPWLKLGMIILGLSIGLGIIAILANLGLMGRSDAIIPAILGICGGSSLLLAYFIDKRSK